MTTFNVAKLETLFNTKISPMDLWPVVSKIESLTNSSYSFSSINQKNRHSFKKRIEKSEGFTEQEYRMITKLKGDHIRGHVFLEIGENGLCYYSEYLGGFSRGNCKTLIKSASEAEPFLVINYPQLSGGYHYDPHNEYKKKETIIKDCKLEDLIC